MWGSGGLWWNWVGFGFLKVLRLLVDTGVFGGGGFRLVFFLLLVSFMLVRLPLVCGLVGLLSLLLVVVFGLFISALLCRLEDFSFFFAEFVPEGVSVGFSVFVSMLEFISYVTRPFVLVLRPLVNLGFGWFLSDVYMSSLCYWGVEGFSFNLIGVFFSLLGMVVVCLYEWCVSCVQWYIVEKIVVSESEA